MVVFRMAGTMKNSKQYRNDYGFYSLRDCSYPLASIKFTNPIIYFLIDSAFIKCQSPPSMSFLLCVHLCFIYLAVLQSTMYDMLKIYRIGQQQKSQRKDAL